MTALRGCPCKDCQDRALGCRETCRHGWQDWDRRNRERYEANKTRVEIETMFCESILRREKRRNTRH